MRTFTEVMSSITRKLNTNVHLQAMSELAVEQPNLSKVLDEVKYVKQDTYNFFIKMATDCTHVIEMYMAGKGNSTQYFAHEGTGEAVLIVAQMSPG